MSIALMTLAWKSALPSGRKMVLLALCDNANDQGECYPSVPMIAQKCSMGERTVQQHITDLETAGIVRRAMRGGRSTVYHIDPRRICTPAESAPPQNLHPTPADFAPPPPQISHPTPADFAPITINEPSIEPSVNQKHSGTSKKNKRPLAGDAGGSLFDFSAELAKLGVQANHIRDWLAVRKLKRAANTEVVLQNLVDESGKAGISVDDAVRVCAIRGWQGFNAEWILPKQQARSGESMRDVARRKTIHGLTGQGGDRNHDNSIIDIN